MARQKSVRKGKSLEKKRKKRGKRGLRGKSVFLLLSVTVSFTPSFSPLSIHHPTTLLYMLSHAHHRTPHRTQHPIQHPTQVHLCTVLFVWTLIPHSIKQHHAIMKPQHIGQQMDDAMSGWERTMMIEDTTPQTPSTTMK